MQVKRVIESIMTWNIAIMPKKKRHACVIFFISFCTKPYAQIAIIKETMPPQIS